MAGFNQRAFCPPMCKAQVNIMTTPFVTLIIKTNTQKWEEHITEERFEGLSIERASRSAMFAAHEFVKRELPFLADSGVAGDELVVSVVDATASLVCTQGKFSIIKNDRFKEFEEQNGLTEPSFKHQADEGNIKELMKCWDRGIAEKMDQCGLKHDDYEQIELFIYHTEGYRDEIKQLKSEIKRLKGS